jgi:hypothetical protein
VNALNAAIEYVKQNQSSMNNDLKQQDKRLQDETFEKNEIKANAQRMGQDLHMLDWLYGQIKNDVRAL